MEQSVENSTTWNWGIDKLNRLREKTDGSTTREFIYDARNNMVEEKHDGITQKRYVYDDLNRLIRVKDGNENVLAAYKYDAFNRRTLKIAGFVTSRYTYDDWNLVEISTPPTGHTNIIDAGMDNHIAMEVETSTGSDMYYFLTDERGNVVALTDESGTILERYRYRVYGEHEVINSCHTACETTYDSCYDGCGDDTCRANCLVAKNICDTNCSSPDYAGDVHNFLWGGSLYEPETGLYWMRNRYYSKSMHRFINQDPIGIWGDANNLGNGFAYVAGMVIEATDPTGLLQIAGNVDFTKVDENISVLLVSGGDIDIAVQELTEASEGIITSVYRKGKRSKHGSGKAVDVSLRYGKNWAHLSLADSRVLARYIKELLGNGYDVVLEHKDSKNFRREKKVGEIWEMGLTTKSGKTVATGSHIHIEWDPKDEDGTPKKDPKKKDTNKDQDASTDSKKDVEKKYEIGYEEVEIEYEEEYWVSYKDEKGNLVIQKKKRLVKKKIKVPVLIEKANNKYPVPGGDDPIDKLQNLILQEMLTKLLKIKTDEQHPTITDNSTGPNGAIIFYKNPYYVSKDPMKSIFVDGNDGSGRPILIRNPFAPKNGVLWSNTYEMWQARGFFMPEVDPWE